MSNVIREEGSDRQDSSKRIRMRNKGRRKAEGRQKKGKRKEEERKREGSDTICYIRKTRKRGQ